ncbi:MAG TPA: hypothetical protein H9876_03870 [Candidatus Limosilactobacillus merdipullorum]|uniref:Uncharacterized protein n=1 Tax=Candidatus Limosilactobacillus merdipullorum TaxID=2838653 RepID=A0A9D1U445_9LACO|nr:hypothetical protein [Candidatus Limosilactobacillus merdipullorum]
MKQNSSCTALKPGAVFLLNGAKAVWMADRLMIHPIQHDAKHAIAGLL